MSADIKWEAVEYGDLKIDDKVRLIGKSGDIVHGEFVGTPAGRYIDTEFVEVWPAQAIKFGIERAVRERTLPTEPGWYIRASDDACIYRLFVDLGHNWYSTDNMQAEYRATAKSRVPDDLVRLVPVTEVEEAEKRGIRKVHERYVSMRNTCTAVEISSAFPDAFTKEA